MSELEIQTLEWRGETGNRENPTRKEKPPAQCWHLSVVGTGGEKSATSKKGMTGKQGLDVASLWHGEVMYSLVINKNTKNKTKKKTNQGTKS